MNEDLNDCVMCGEDVMQDRAAWLRGQRMLTTCLKCGERQARQVKHTVLTLHKQGPMAFTAEFGRTAAANNKGGQWVLTTREG
jgi:predicted  nucleic acid-binding Zn-ribbon protein